MYPNPWTFLWLLHAFANQKLMGTQDEETLKAILSYMTGPFYFLFLFFHFGLKIYYWSLLSEKGHPIILKCTPTFEMIHQSI